MAGSSRFDGLPGLGALKQRFERQVAALRSAPALGAERAEARVRLAYGLACDVEHDDRTIRVDLPVSEGGGATGPHPGQLLRASLGACLAMGYRIWAARLDVPLDDVTVHVACEYDTRGQLGVDAAVPAGWTRVEFDVVIESPASAEEIGRVVDTTHRLSPMLANLSAGIELVFRLRVVLGADAERNVPPDVTRAG